ncbi:hypothetical protein GcC1_c13610o44 [Golovinomyces cichoracearum]|uniref:Uncharacterized protein n=1 Tax=Golovinomyces cichoracearum TaxID=62708 RepID=A0A420J2S9_9PEZI|nr:hypothetical protein GcC1_c13610o44 [Golovinomyces cichoracearum]
MRFPMWKFMFFLSQGLSIEFLESFRRTSLKITHNVHFREKNDEFVLNLICLSQSSLTH